VSTKEFLSQEYLELMILRGITDFTGLHLGGLKAMGVDFSKAFFNNTNLNGVDFREARFFKNKDVFIDCFMIETIFKSCDLSKVGFFRNQMARSDFQLADLTGSDFVECDLRGAIFNNATLKKTVFKECILDDVNFSRSSTLEDASFINCILGGVTVRTIKMV
jgi:fluoroquinolone resistance protein